jgi:hypothetical protein
MDDLKIKLLGLLKAKTFWVGIVLAAVTNFAPIVQTWVATHPGTAGGVVAMVFGVVMRWLTTESLATKGAASPPAP